MTEELARAARRIDLSRSDVFHFMPGDAPVDLQPGEHKAEDLGFVSDPNLLIEPDGSVEWCDLDEDDETNERSSEKFRWCLVNCEGPWLLTSLHHERHENFEISVQFLNSDDARRYRIWAALTECP